MLRKAFLSGPSAAWREEEGEGGCSVLQPRSPPGLESPSVGTGHRDGVRTPAVGQQSPDSNAALRGRRSKVIPVPKTSRDGTAVAGTI